MKNEFIKNNEQILEGKNPVFEAYKSGKSFKKIFVLKGLKDNRINELLDEVKKDGTIISFVERDEIDKLSETKSNQGILAITSEFKYSEVEDIIDYAKGKNEEPFIVILDEIMDPHNFGAIIRTVNSVGAHGIIIKNRNQVMVTPTVVSASSGATNYVKIARVNNLSKTIEDLKKEGIWFVAADMNGDIMYKTNMTGSIALVVGNEGSGVSRLVKEKCDFVSKIPMCGNIDSLNVSVAAGVLLYEIYRQRMSL